MIVRYQRGVGFELTLTGVRFAAAAWVYSVFDRTFDLGISTVRASLGVYYY